MASAESSQQQSHLSGQHVLPCLFPPAGDQAASAVGGCAWPAKRHASTSLLAALNHIKSALAPLGGLGVYRTHAGLGREKGSVTSRNAT